MDFLFTFSVLLLIDLFYASPDKAAVTETVNLSGRPNVYLDEFVSINDIVAEIAKAWNIDPARSRLYKCAPSRALVYSVWKEHFPQVVKAPDGAWSLCERCLDLGQRKKKLKQSKVLASSNQFKDFLQEVEDHQATYTEERMSATRRLQLATLQPEKYAVITLDMARKFQYPHRPVVNEQLRRASCAKVNYGSGNSFFSAEVSSILFVFVSH